MQAAKRPEAPLLPLLLAWVRHRITQFLASRKPQYTAEEIAARVAGGGNPTGV